MRVSVATSWAYWRRKRPSSKCTVPSAECRVSQGGTPGAFVSGGIACIAPYSLGNWHCALSTSSVLDDGADFDQAAVVEDGAALGDLGGLGFVGGFDLIIAADRILRLGVGAIDDELAVAGAHSAPTVGELVRADESPFLAEAVGPGE